jgi:hypothetical protein
VLRAQAKRSSAANRDGSAPRGSVFGRRNAATRASSPSADGSGAPSHRGRLSILALAIAALALLAFAPLSQAKIAINGYGVGPIGGGVGANLGGVLNDVTGIAVNNSGAGAPRGTFYVADNFGRVSRFSPSGAWERAWGFDVIATSYNEKQRLTVNATGGTFTLTFGGQTTDPIPFDAKQGGSSSDPDTVYGQLVSLGAIGSKANLAVSASETTPCNSASGCTYEFVGALAATDMPQITVDTSQLDGTATVRTLVNGADAATTGGSSTGFEICVVAGHCRVQSTLSDTANGGQILAAQGVAVNQANGHVYVTTNYERRVSEFDADGNFVRAWGWDTITSGRPGDLGSAAFEICTVAADCKTAAAAGINGGQFANRMGYPVLDASGNVWVPDPANRRIQEFDSTGNFIAAYGFNVNNGGALERCTSTTAGVCRAGTNGSGAGQFGTAGPTQIAFDNLGNLYAIDPSNNRVQRFDSAFTTASNFASATFPGLSSAAPEQVTATQGGTRLAFSLNRNIGSPVERQIVEIDPTDGSVKDTSLAGVGLGNVSGLAEDPNSGNLYATTTSSISPFRRIIVLGAGIADVFVSLNSITTKTDTTATFSGTINPNGGWITGCKFQYSTDPGFTASKDAPVDCDSLPANGGFQPVSAGVAGLLPNTTYFVRLQASRPLVANSTVTTSAKFFTTDSVPPAIANVGAVDIADTSARLVATIDPRNNPTGYVFEYGTTPALGSSTAPLNIGAGTTPITVSQVVSGLRADTDYYFRAVATNTVGSTASPAETFHTRAEPLPDPGGRAWEQVSPIDKNYGDANSGAFAINAAGVSIDGDAVGYCTTALFGEPTAQMMVSCSPYIARRTAGGWQTPNNLPPICRYDTVSGVEDGQLSLSPSADYSRVLVVKGESAGCPIAPLDPAAPLVDGATSFNLYLQDPSVDPAAYQLLNPRAGRNHNGVYNNDSHFYVGGSDDFGHVVYQSQANQTDPPDSPALGQPGGDDFRKLYDYEREGVGGCATPGGCLSLVSKDTSNVPFTTESSIAAFRYRVGYLPAPSAVSSDGERIFFSNPVVETFEPVARCGDGCELYLREGGAVTYDVSASECTVDCGTPQAFGDQFLSATPSGGHAFFTSCAKLTDDAPLNSCSNLDSQLYRWDRNAPSGGRLVDLIVDREPSDGSAPGLLGLIGHSDDGETAYFVARNQIVAGQPTFPTSEIRIRSSVESVIDNAKLYRWRYNGGSPTVDYIGPYQQVNGRWGIEDMNWKGHLRQVTPDGRYLMIFSKLRLVAGDRDADADVYRWGEAEGWTCVSCQLPGAPSGGDVDLSQVEFAYTSSFTSEFNSFELENYMSDDGRRIFFGTPDALVAQDTNGEVGCSPHSSTLAWPHELFNCEDVYEWHDGTLNLLSSGTDEDASRLIGASLDGRDVFFWTRDRLVGWDVDNNVDIYDARLGGGFPEPPAVPPICDAAEGCRGPASVGVDIPGAGSAAIVGPENPPPPVRCPRGKRRVTRNGRTRCVARKHRRGNRAAKHNRRAAR